MLPGIRFLLAAIVLSISLLIFGLGAAALLRAAHEEVANVPTRRVMAEPVFAQRRDATVPSLAMLRIDPEEPGKTPDAPPAAMSRPEPAAELVPEPRAETEKAAALKQDETEVAETSTPPPAATAPAAPAETRLAALDAAPSAGAAPVALEQIATSATTDADLPATKMAALGDPSATSETTSEAGKADETPDRAEIRRKKRAERARERRRQAARRARLAAQQAAAQQTLDPFSGLMQPSQPITTTTTIPRRRQ